MWKITESYLTFEHLYFKLLFRLFVLIAYSRFYFHKAQSSVLLNPSI
jgi:hypothetical protein